MICTSGSAAYNFAPAIAEAYFQHTPLLVLTADRPNEWIDQLDGQTIRQKELYGNHVKKYFELTLDYSHPDSEWHANRIVNEAINLANTGQKGPVHINVPLREPLYPSFTSKSEANERSDVRIIENSSTVSTIPQGELEQLHQHINGINKILIVSGQSNPDQELVNILKQVTKAYHWPVAGDILSNLHSLPSFCGHTDTFLGQLAESKKVLLQPDLLITFGKSLISKNLKLFLRKYKPREHWHLQESGDVADTFQSLTKIIRVNPYHFFSDLVNKSLTVNKYWSEFSDHWNTTESKTSSILREFFQKKRGGEFEFVKAIMESLPADCNLHLANSMTVRYANHIGLTDSRKDTAVFSNRGTSGIDGCTSTAVGYALAADRLNVLITGDLAFFYDRNAFWHNYSLPNLFIIVLNNHGGIIFNLIDGPAGLPESEEYFITRQNLKAKSLATEFGLSYSDGSSDLNAFFKKDKNTKILELESSQSTNKQIFEEFKKEINKNL